jgi:acetyltransferase-like isoleucine patch superfamily enzyme
LANIHPRTKIGRYCSFADGVRVSHANHPITFRSVHPFFYLPKCGCVEEESITRGSIEIGNDVWIGWNAIILAGVKKIGDGAVIGAGAVVTRDIPDFAVVAGNPAKVIKFRFSEDVQESIRRSKWWDKEIEELEVNLEDFLHPLGEANCAGFGQSREKQV